MSIHHYNCCPATFDGTAQEEITPHTSQVKLECIIYMKSKSDNHTDKEAEAEGLTAPCSTVQCNRMKSNSKGTTTKARFLCFYQWPRWKCENNRRS